MNLANMHDEVVTIEQRDTDLEETSKFIKDVLCKSHKSILKDLVPELLLDVFEVDGTFGEDNEIQVRDLRDILKNTTTTSCNRAIHDVFNRNPTREYYIKLKAALVRTNQRELLDIIEHNERGIHNAKKGLLPGCYCADDSMCVFLEQFKCPKDTQHYVPPEIKHIRQKLIEMYEAENQNITVVFMEFNDTQIPVKDMYVQPCLQRKTISHGPTISNKRPGASVKLQSLRDVFYINDKKCRRIYISGNAGCGKSVFCKHLIHLWCKAHKNHPNEHSEDEKVLANYQLLFYVNLSGQRHCDIAGIISDSLDLKHIRVTKTDLNGRFLQDKEDQVLLLMDALDECKEKRLPRESKHSNCTTVITSRPWMIEQLRSDPEFKIGHEIEILGLDDISSMTLVDKLLKINKSGGKDSKNFKLKMEEAGLEKFLYTPVLIPPMFSLWFDDKPFGKSEEEIYRNIIHHQILAAIRHKPLPRYSRTINTSHPVCQQNECRCKRYSHLFEKLSEFAFTLLTSIQKDNEGDTHSSAGHVSEIARVVHHDQKALPELSEKDLEICLKLGFLTQNILIGSLSDPKRKAVSFIHRTFLEWFAARYLATTTLDTSELSKVLGAVYFDLNSVLEYDKIFTFLCGQSEAAAETLSILIMETVSSDKRVKRYRRSSRLDKRTSVDDSRLIAKIQDVIASGTVNARNRKMSTALQLDDIRIDETNVREIFKPELILDCNTSFVKSMYVTARADSRYSLPTWSTSSCMENIDLTNVDLTSCKTFGNKLSLDQLFSFHLKNVKMTHQQADGLVRSLTYAENLRYVHIDDILVRSRRVVTPSYQSYVRPLSLFMLLLAPCVHAMRNPFATPNVIQLDVSKLSSLEVFVYQNINSSVKLVSWPISSCIKAIHVCRAYIQFCNTFTDNFSTGNLTSIQIDLVIMTHDQIKCLLTRLALANHLKHVLIKDVVCETHEDSGKCSKELDVSKLKSLETKKLIFQKNGSLKLTAWTPFSCMTMIELRHVDLSSCVTFQDDFRVAGLSKLCLNNMTLTHAQIWCLYRSLVIVNDHKCHIDVAIADLTCSTHLGESCEIEVDLSRHKGPIQLNYQYMSELSRCPTSSMKLPTSIEDFSLRGGELGDDIIEILRASRLTKLHLDNVTMEHKHIKYLCENLIMVRDRDIDISIRDLLCSTHKNEACIVKTDRGLKSPNMKNLGDSLWGVDLSF